MRILASIKPLTTSLPKPPYDGFFECTSFQFEGSLDSLAPAAHFTLDDAKLTHPLDAFSSDLLDACVAGTKLDINVLYEQTGAGGTFVYLKVNLAQATVGRVNHHGVAGGSPLPVEQVSFSPSAVNGTFYDAGGRELGRTSFNR
jgi:type VI protein secretion system component Hcp